MFNSKDEYTQALRTAVKELFNDHDIVVDSSGYDPGKLWVGTKNSRKHEFIDDDTAIETLRTVQEVFTHHNLGDWEHEDADAGMLEILNNPPYPGSEDDFEDIDTGIDALE